MLRKTQFLSLILLFFICFQCVSVYAQTAITPEMMRAYQNLTPAQRQQALQMLQGGGGISMDTGMGAAQSTEDTGLQGMGIAGLNLSEFFQVLCT